MSRFVLFLLIFACGVRSFQHRLVKRLTPLRFLCYLLFCPHPHSVPLLLPITGCSSGSFQLPPGLLLADASLVYARSGSRHRFLFSDGCQAEGPVFHDLSGQGPVAVPGQAQACCSLGQHTERWGQRDWLPLAPP